MSDNNQETEQRFSENDVKKLLLLLLKKYSIGGYQIIMRLFMEGKPLSEMIKSFATIEDNKIILNDEETNDWYDRIIQRHEDNKQ